MKYTLILILAMVFATFVSHAQADTKKVVIIKKVKDDNGTVTTEEIEASGAEADKLLEKMKKDGDLEGIDINVEIEKAATGNTSISNTKTEDIHIEKKMVNGVETTSYTITTIDNGAKQVMVWNGDGEMPAEMAEKIKKHEMRQDDGSEQEIRVISEESDSEINSEMNTPVMSANKVTLGVIINDEQGVVIDEIFDDSTAARAGLQVGDLILKIDGDYIFNTEMLLHGLSTYDKGDVSNLLIMRDGKEMTKTAQF